MIIYSVSVTIEKSIEAEWLDWMKEIHIPQVIDTGFFIDWNIHKVIIPEDYINEVTFRIDYTLKSIKHYEDYINSSASKLQKEHSVKFEGKFKASRAVYSILKK